MVLSLLGVRVSVLPNSTMITVLDKSSAYPLMKPLDSVRLVLKIAGLLGGQYEVSLDFNDVYSNLELTS